MADRRCYYVYILASRIGGTLYIGITNNLVRRVCEHRSKFVDSFALIVGGVLFAVATVMREAARLADENAAFV